MSKYIITTDSTCDLPSQYLSTNKDDLHIIPLTFTMEGKNYYDGDLEFDYFYEKLRSGVIPTTSQITPERAKEEFEKFIKEGYDIIHIAFSSGLSGSYQSASIAANDIMEEGCEQRITVIDSLSASTGQGLLVHKALMFKKNGAEYDELVKYIQDTRLHICHGFTVDDLFFLHKGGRVSKTTAILGSAINIKPILHVDNEGHLINIDKVRGRKKSILKLVDYVMDRIEGYEDKNSTIAICQGDCKEDADFLVSKLKEKMSFDEVIISYTGTVIGTHSGPGTLAIFFEGKAREI